VLENECVLVGSAAAHFPVTWYLSVRLTPTPEEVAQFVREYEDARRVSFTPAEHRQIAAAATYVIAYTARCEHAIDLQGKYYAGSFREALAAAGDHDYLSI
jgi:hypothetical protein